MDINETINFKGYFKIESIDANNNVIDMYEDKNMIMVPARTTMSELFSNLASNTFINKISFGTMGHVVPDVLHEKAAVDGFVNTRDRMFSESGSTVASPTVMNSVLSVLNLNDVYYMVATNPVQSGYYRFLKASTTNYTVTDVLITTLTEWESLGTTAPYIYDITFTIPGTNVNQVVGDSATSIVETDVGSGSTVTVLQSGTSVTFSFDVVTSAANSQYGTYSAFTEAALYANGRIFSLKTFKNKVKDSTIALRVTWKITF